MTKMRTNPWIALLVLCAGFFMILLDTTIVNIAIPSILDELHASLDQILWVLNFYLLTYAVFLITSGRLGDLFGQRNMFAVGLAGFTIASAFCGLAQDPTQLIVARAVQGVMGAIITPQTLAMLTAIFPPERRGAAFGIWGAVAGVAAVAGPTLGGFIVSNFSWRWIFYVNVPVGIAAFVASFVLLPSIKTGRAHKFDVVGILLSAGGLLAVVYGLIEGQRYDWGTITAVSFGGFQPTIPEVLALGVVLLIAFLVFEHFQPEPLLPLNLFTIRNFAVMNWIAAAVAFAMLGFFLPLTIYFQSVLGYSAIKAGLVFAPTPLISMLIAPWSGRFADKVGGKYILMFGLTFFGLGLGYVIWSAHVDSDWPTFLPGLIVAGLGMGCTFAPMQTMAMQDITPRLAGAASGVINTTRQLGGVVGSAVVGAVLQNRLATALHDQAVTYSSQLPPQVPKQKFIDGFSNAAQGGFSVGRGQTGGSVQLPPGVPPDVKAQIVQLGHDVFTNGFVNAMRPTLAVSIIVLLIGAASTVFARRVTGAHLRERAEAAETASPEAAPAV